MKNDFIDISLPIRPEMAVWPKTQGTEFSVRRSMEKGDNSNNSNLSMNCHSGTHIDAPLHFVRNGASIDKIPLDVFVGEAFVLDLSAYSEIRIDHLEKHWPKSGCDRILLKTKNSGLWKQNPHSFVETYCALTEETARWFLEKKIRLIGIDYMSIQHYGDSPIVHQLLLGEGVVILESIDLSSVNEGSYELISLPIKLAGLEAAPVRAVLRRNVT